MKNIELIEKKVKKLLEMIDLGLTDPNLKEDDLTYMKIMSNRYLREIALIKTTLKISEDKIKESEFKEFIIHIDNFAKKGNELIKAK